MFNFVWHSGVFLFRFKLESCNEWTSLLLGDGGLWCPDEELGQRWPGGGDELAETVEARDTAGGGTSEVLELDGSGAWELSLGLLEVVLQLVLVGLGQVADLDNSVPDVLWVGVAREGGNLGADKVGNILGDGAESSLEASEEGPWLGLTIADLLLGLGEDLLHLVVGWLNDSLWVLERGTEAAGGLADG